MKVVVFVSDIVMKELKRICDVNKEASVLNALSNCFMLGVSKYAKLAGATCLYYDEEYAKFELDKSSYKTLRETHERMVIDGNCYIDLDGFFRACLFEGVFGMGEKLDSLN